MGSNFAEKLIASHLVAGAMEPGAEIGLKIDQTLTQDATGAMVMLELDALGLERAATDVSVQYVDHNLLQADERNMADHLFLRSAARRYGLWYSPPGNVSRIRRTWSASACPARRWRAPTRTPARPAAWACSRAPAQRPRDREERSEPWPRRNLTATTRQRATALTRRVAGTAPHAAGAVRDWDELLSEVREREDFQERIVVNLGPQHPSTHGVPRLILELDGETVIEARCRSCSRTAHRLARPARPRRRRAGIDPKHVRHIMAESMESLIYHFKLVTDGCNVPAGQVYTAAESLRGELGAHLISDEGARLYRVHLRDPTLRSTASPVTDPRSMT